MTLREKTSRKNSPKPNSNQHGSEKAITLEMQSRTVDQNNNLHARNPSTKAPDIGLMKVSTSREVFKN